MELKPREEDAAAEANTGRWSKPEHELFLRGLNEFGRDWKQIGSLIKSRTVVQIRTHAQKYFLANKKHEEADLSVPAFPDKAKTSRKRTNSAGSMTATSNKPRTKKKKDEEHNLDLKNLFDLVDAWSSGSDEGTPTSVDELDFLRTTAQEVPAYPAPEERAQTPHPVEPPADLPGFPADPVQHFLPSQDALASNRLTQGLVSSHQLQLQLQMQTQIPAQSAPNRDSSSTPPPPEALHHDNLDASGSAATEMVDLANTFDPLPPSLEFVLLGRWMDTFTE